jgi:maltodextrin utilization protein YvdJ
MKHLLEKHNWWLQWAWKSLLVILVLISGYLIPMAIARYNIETTTHAAETYLTRKQFEEVNAKIMDVLNDLEAMSERYRLRQKIDRAEIVKINNLHKVPTADYTD